MQLYIIRHGETKHNIKGYCQGQIQGELNTNGINQAKDISKEFDNLIIDLVYTSDLNRAQQTANIIFGNKNIQIINDIRLRERFLGEFQDKPFPKDFDYNKNYIKGTESVDQMFIRVREFISFIKENYSTKNIAIVSHGITIKVIKAVLRGANNIDGIKTTPNCSITKFNL